MCLGIYIGADRPISSKGYQRGSHRIDRVANQLGWLLDVLKTTHAAVIHADQSCCCAFAGDGIAPEDTVQRDQLVDGLVAHLTELSGAGSTKLLLCWMGDEHRTTTYMGSANAQRIAELDFFDHASGEPQLYDVRLES